MVCSFVCQMFKLPATYKHVNLSMQISAKIQSGYFNLHTANQNMVRLLHDINEQQQQAYILVLYLNLSGISGAERDAAPSDSIYVVALNAGIAHLMGSLKAEASSKTVGVHTLSPGMVLTNLLLEGATLENKQIFNILCEQVYVITSAKVYVSFSHAS